EVADAVFLGEQSHAFDALVRVAAKHLIGIHLLESYFLKARHRLPPLLIFAAGIFRWINQTADEMQIAHVVVFPLAAREGRGLVNEAMVAGNNLDLAGRVS